jgi:hypothetical protein
MPPAYVVTADAIVGNNGYVDAVYYPEVSARLTLNTGQTSEITLTDLGLEDYYFGMYIQQIAHGIFWYKTQAFPISDVAFATNKWITADISVPGDFPNVFNDGTTIYVYFILSSEDKSTDHSTPAIWIPLPADTHNSVVMVEYKEMHTGLWITADPAVPDQFNWDITEPGSEKGVDISTSINVSSHVAGWQVLTQPAWITTHVWNPIDNRIETLPWYDGLQLHISCTADNTGVARVGNIELADGDDNVLCTIPVGQDGGPCTAECIRFGGTWVLESQSATVVTGSPIINITFTVSGLSGSSVPIYFTVYRDAIKLLFDDTHTARDLPYSQTYNLTMGENAIGGGHYHVYISATGEVEFIP